MMRSILTGPAFCLVLACALAACAGSQSNATNPNAPPVNGGDASHYAGTYYPIYGKSDKPPEWIPATPSMPFDKVSHVFVAFVHAYDKDNGAVLDFQRDQPDQAARLKNLETVARGKNSHIKVLITLGWGKNFKDWNAIAKDYKNKANLFVPSVVDLLKKNDLDGFDIDDESIGPPPGYESGNISQAHFNAVIAQLRAALDQASKKDQRTYALVITPAGNNKTTDGYNETNIDETNASSFDWVNIQSYYGYPSFSQDLIASLKNINYPSSSIAVGVDTDSDTPCQPQFPDFDGLKGIFNWNMTADSDCGAGYEYTLKIAKDVGY